MTSLDEMFPDFRKRVDPFEDELTEFVATAGPAELTLLVTRATQFIEELCEKSDAHTFQTEGWAQLTNATSACNTAVLALKRRIRT